MVGTTAVYPSCSLLSWRALWTASDSMSTHSFILSSIHLPSAGDKELFVPGEGRDVIPSPEDSLRRETGFSRP